MSRYLGREIATNDNKLHKKKFKKRGVKSVEQYRTPKFRSPSDGDIFSLDLTYYTWSLGDSFWKLSSAYYGDPQYWWVIASINKTPTESVLKIGDTIAIPYDLAQALQVVE